jgi:hypothetical protein
MTTESEKVTINKLIDMVASLSMENYDLKKKISELQVIILKFTLKDET